MHQSVLNTIIHIDIHTYIYSSGYCTSHGYLFPSAAILNVTGNGQFRKIQDRRQITNTDNTQTEHNPEKSKQHKTKLAWFSRL